MKSKSGTIWKPEEQWTFVTAEKNGSTGYIENSQKDIGLGINGDSVHEVTSYQNDATQIWKKGEPDCEGYFTLTSLGSQKVLTAISDQILEIKGKYIPWNYFIIFAILFFFPIDHEFYASKVLVDENEPSENVASKDMWIYGANAIHLAAKFMPQGLELLLSSLEDNSRLIDTASYYECAPLHVAAKNNDSLSTRYLYNSEILH